MQSPKWSKQADKKWRSTFTRDNKVGEALLRYRLRHETPEQIAKSNKAEHLAREDKEDKEYAANLKAAMKDATQHEIFVDGSTTKFHVEHPRAGLKCRVTWTRTEKITEEFDLDGNVKVTVEKLEA